MADIEGKVTGLITDRSSGRPLPGAQVQAAGAEGRAVTGEDGRYALSLAPNTYIVRVNVLGFNPLSHNVVVAAGQTATQDFELTTSAVARDGL